MKQARAKMDGGIEKLDFFLIKKMKRNEGNIARVDKKIIYRLNKHKGLFV